MDQLAAIFKSYDIRGKVGTELTSEVANKIGQAFGLWLPKNGPVAVGRDMRPDSEDLATNLIDGLIAQGRDVWDIGQVTSDMIYFAAGKYGLAGGAVVTASHNPSEYNGIKLCADEAKAVGLEFGLSEIRDMVIKNDFKPAASRGKITQKDITEDWIAHVLSFVEIDKLKPLKIAVDAGNGMAGKIFPVFEKYVPFKVTRMYFELDGTFPNHEANPLKPETLIDLSKTIKKNALDGGVAFDGDGDRGFLVDETGQMLSGGVMSSMIAEYFLQKYPGATIVYDARNSKSVPELVNELGGKSVRSRVGHSNIKKMMRELDAPFGGEASGHFYLRDNWYADSGIIGILVGLYLMCLSGKKMSDLREQYTRYEAIPETNFEVVDKDKILSSLKEVFADEKQDELDGLTINLNNGSWFNIRPSNTEPLLRLNAEAKAKEDLDKLVARVQQIIQT
ncbi:phosphomannomutase/phosphoglucomutase [Candidatus Saccharibacteria bacterium CG10_big_fil_rev_8_21_14_0_10_47_8]|nr:MAG: phosphomannomutase/phosphoglucomutase [Candidatus Saccharibacteria bacterium CG10_big_fil_rev_8_21_14_0_10_47_8]